MFQLAAGDEVPYAGVAIGAVLGAAAAWVASRIVDPAAAGGSAGGIAVIVAGAGLAAAAGRADPVRRLRAPARRRLVRPPRPACAGSQVRGPAGAPLNGGKKLVLVVVDGLGVPLLDRALEARRAPTIAALIERGERHPDCASSFPSLTPVCLSAIATGRHPDGSFIPGLTWYRRGEGRFVEYGSSFSATLVEGSHAAINDSILNLNHLHLSQNVRTVFELVEDDGLVAAAINYYVFRGRVRHPLKHPAVAALARKIGVFDAAYGPSRFYFGELFASDRTGASPNLGVHAANDTQAAEIGRWLVARDGFDFLLYYLPDVDMAQHKLGPAAARSTPWRAPTGRSRAWSTPAAGSTGSSRTTAWCCSPTTARRRRARRATCGRRWRACACSSARCARRRAARQVAVAASNRVCMLYRLADAPELARPRRARRRARRRRPGGVLRGRRRRAAARRRELRFRRGGPLRDRRGNPWTVTGDFAALGLEQDGDVVAAPGYPNALERVACLLECVNAGEVVCSAAAGYEFVDGGGSHHVGGGSHGSLSADDSVVPLITVGVDASRLPGEPSITDAYGLVQRHFGL